MCFAPGCATVTEHNFAEPTTAWQTRVGQLQYRSMERTLTGDLLVRFSPGGESYLAFSKGADLMVVRQDKQFASVQGPLARGGWQGKINAVPKRYQGWVSLAERVREARRPYIRHDVGTETFLLRF